MDRLINRKVLSLTLCIILISVFTLTIAYAALSVTLNIVGSAEISDASWNIKFSNIKVNSASVSISPKITNNTTLTFSANLENPGDFYKFTVDIVNDGSIDAMIDSIIKTPELTTEQKKYLRYEVKYSDGQDISTKQILKAKETKTISVLFSFRNDIPVSDLPTTSSNFNVKLQLAYYQSDNTGVNITTGSNKVKVLSGNMDTVGSEVCIDTECFYVISSDSYSVTMLAKYNLYVGNKCTSCSSSSCVAYGEEATGKQDATMIGYSETQTIRKGTLAFSKTNYFYNEVISLPSYVYNKKSLLYNYMENYKTYLISLGVVTIEARPIATEELENLGCIVGNKTCTSAPSWVCSSSYWTGTAYSSSRLYGVGSACNVDNFGYNYDYGVGVRPVITIPKTEF